MAKNKKRIEVYEGQVLEKDLYDTGTGMVLCKAGTIVTPELILRLNNWIVEVSKGERKQEDEKAAPPASFDRNQVLQRMNFEKVISDESRSELQDRSEQVLSGVSIGAEGIDLEAIRETVAMFVGELPDSDDVPLKLGEMESHASYMYQHSIECGIMASFVASQLNYSRDDVISFSTAMILHDIGIMTVPNEILTKKTPLNDEEWATVKNHTEAGFALLRAVTGIDPLSLIVTRGHHVHADGSGYPADIVFNSMHQLAHLSVIINDFEVLTAEYRPFRRAAGLHGAVRTMLQFRHKYHHRAMDDFVRVVGVYPISTFVTLNTGEIGVVVRNNHENLFMPELKLITDPKGHEYSKEIIVNLMDDTDRYITGVKEE